MKWRKNKTFPYLYLVNEISVNDSPLHQMSQRYSISYDIVDIRYPIRYSHAKSVNSIEFSRSYFCRTGENVRFCLPPTFVSFCGYRPEDSSWKLMTCHWAQYVTKYHKLTPGEVSYEVPSAIHDQVMGSSWSISNFSMVFLCVVKGI